jgi:hypothetical protein
MKIPNWLIYTLLALLVVVLSLGGCAAGMPLGTAWNSGSLARWDRLPDPPAAPAAIVTGSTAEVYIETADGGIYYCNPADEVCWVESDTPEPLAARNEDCEDWPIRYQVRPAPGTVIDSLQTQWCHFEAGEEVDYAILDDGSVWMWSHFDANYLNMARVLVPMGGGCLAGLLVGIVLIVVVWRRRRRQAGAAP